MKVRERTMPLARAGSSLDPSINTASRIVAVDEGNAGAGTDIRREGRLGKEVVQQVGHHSDLADLVVHRTGEGNVVLVVAVDSLDLEARTDEIVADLAAHREATVRRHRRTEDGGVQEPVDAALRAELEIRLGWCLGLSHRRHCNNCRARNPNYSHSQSLLEYS